MEDLPDDASIEDAMEFYLLYKVEQGLAQIEVGQCVIHEDATARINHGLS